MIAGGIAGFNTGVSRFLRFAGTDVVRGSEEFAQEVVDFFDERVDRNSGAQ
jgi:hypothetical protein